MGCFESKFGMNDIYCSCADGTSKATYRYYKEIPIKQDLFSTDDHDLQDFLETPTGRRIAPYIVMSKKENGKWKVLARGCKFCVSENQCLFDHKPFGFYE